MNHLLASTAIDLLPAYASQPITPEMAQRTKAFRAAHPEANNDIGHDEVTRRSKDSAAMLSYWDKVDTIVGGIEAMRAAGERYLPKFNDEDATDYDFRLKTTKMTNVYKDIIDGLAGKPFEQPVQLLKSGEIEPPQEMVDFAENVDGSGNNLTVFAANTMFNGINSAIDWIHVDHPDTGGEPMTLAEYKARGYRPYWSHVLGRNVLDVQSKMVGGVETLTYFKVFEPGDAERVREFRRSDEGVVTWTLRRKTSEQGADGKSKWVVEGSGTLAGLDVIPMVPFITGRRIGRTWQIDPVMRDAADLQVELYEQESGLKFAKKLTAYPMLAANGIKPEKDSNGKPIYKVAVGPNRVLFTGTGSNGQTGSWSYLEPGSESLKFLAADINDTIKELRELGRQPLTASSSNITIITAMVAALKARSAVRAWAIMLKDALENAMILTNRWLKVEWVPNINVFLDFDDFMGTDDLDTLNSARDRGDISRETYWDGLKRRGVLNSDFNAVDEARRLLAEGPVSADEDITNG